MTSADRWNATIDAAAAALRAAKEQVNAELCARLRTIKAASQMPPDQIPEDIARLVRAPLAGLDAPAAKEAGAQKISSNDEHAKP